MFGKNDVLKLAALSRLAITDEEAEKLATEMGGILKYVSTLSSAPSPDTEGNKSYHDEINQFREDGVPHESGLYTEKILGQAPMSEKGFLKVKKIL